MFLQHCFVILRFLGIMLVRIKLLLQSNLKTVNRATDKQVNQSLPVQQSLTRIIKYDNQHLVAQKVFGAFTAVRRQDVCPISVQNTSSFHKLVKVMGQTCPLCFHHFAFHDCNSTNLVILTLHLQTDVCKISAGQTKYYLTNQLYGSSIF